MTCIGAHDGAPPQPEPGLLICKRHRRQLGNDLAAVSGLWSLLPVFIQPGAGTSGTHGKPGSRPPINLDVADILDPRGTVHQQLTSWARVVIEDRRLAARSLDADQAARLLAVHADWLAAQPFADEALAEIHDCAHTVRRACRDLPDPPLGTCPDLDPDGVTDICGGPLRWVDGTSSIRCGRCASWWDTDSLVHIGRVAPVNLWESVPRIADMLNVSERTVRHWVLTGKVTRNSLGQVNHADVWRHAHRERNASAAES